MAVSKRTRYEVLRRDNYTCRYCGAKAPDVVLHVDHVVPEALGGSDNPGNLVAACEDCNAGKAATSPDETVVEDVRQDALRWSRAMQHAAQLLARDEQERRNYVERVRVEWAGWHYEEDEPIPVDDDWRVTVGRFHDLGLPLNVALEMVPVAMTAPGVPVDRRFRYFAGCCWNRIREMQDISSSLMEIDEEHWR